MSPQALKRTLIEARELNPCGFEVSEGALQRFQELVQTHCGVAHGINSRLFVARRLDQRCKELGCCNLDQYNEILVFDDPEESEIGLAVDLVTTHETYFFRESRQLEILCTDLLSQRSKLGQSGSSLALWSAGCSTGEEVYSLSMMLEQHGSIRSERTRIIGTDISRKAIEYARAGVYRRSSFRNTSEEQLRNYFDAVDDGHYRVKETYRKPCCFRVQNLAFPGDEDGRGVLDVIFCRNVLMYLSSSVRQDLVEHFHRQLCPGGFLLLGRSESLVNVSNPFAEIQIDQELVYQKN